MGADLTVNGVAVADDGSTSQRVIVLPAGRRASIRRGVGRDLIRAQRAAQSSEPAAIIFALIAELITIDARHIVYEDVLAMEITARGPQWVFLSYGRKHHDIALIRAEGDAQLGAQALL